jgi:hypothetical protein
MFRDGRPQVLHRPGLVPVTDDADPSAAAWEARNRRLAEAWKTPPRQAKPSMQQHDRARDVPDVASRTAEEARAICDRAWEARNKRLADAWRTPSR